MRLPSPAAKPQIETLRSPRGSRATRWLVHGAVFTAALLAGGVGLVWPQWLALDGAHAALEVQQEREQDFQDRLDSVHTLNNRLHDWQNESRRVFLPEELNQYSRVVQGVARREGVQVLKYQVKAASGGRWRAVALQQYGSDGHAEVAGEIQPRSIRVVLTGSFEGVYRAIAALSQQQQLFLPDQWDIAPAAPNGPAGGPLRAEVTATVFTVQEPEDRPVAPLKTTGPVAANLPLEKLP